PSGPRSLNRTPDRLGIPYESGLTRFGINRLLQVLEHRLNVVEEVSSLDMMLTLVGAGYGIGFMTATKIPISQRPDVVIRPLAQDTAVITTYLLRPESSNSSVSLDRFMERLRGPPDD
ncbi:LysR substrate-binding domain-containing protein, partial [Tistrella bauzanensis]|uniref:LysR substrate-binding domain-containing protein n=1 Tax=Tistrella bauzanensis TaxID=657419 RepID=UPI001E5BB0FD